MSLHQPIIRVGLLTVLLLRAAVTFCLGAGWASQARRPTCCLWSSEPAASKWVLISAGAVR